MDRGVLVCAGSRHTDKTHQVQFLKTLREKEVTREYEIQVYVKFG